MRRSPRTPSWSDGVARSAQPALPGPEGWSEVRCAPSANRVTTGTGRAELSCPATGHADGCPPRAAGCIQPYRWPMPDSIIPRVEGRDSTWASRGAPARASPGAQHRVGFDGIDRGRASDGDLDREHAGARWNASGSSSRACRSVADVDAGRDIVNIALPAMQSDFPDRPDDDRMGSWSPTARGRLAAPPVRPPRRGADVQTGLPRGFPIFTLASVCAAPPRTKCGWSLPRGPGVGAAMVNGHGPAIVARRSRPTSAGGPWASTGSACRSALSLGPPWRDPHPGRDMAGDLPHQAPIRVVRDPVGKSDPARRDPPAGARRSNIKGAAALGDLALSAPPRPRTASNGAWTSPAIMALLWLSWSWVPPSIVVERRLVQP